MNYKRFGVMLDVSRNGVMKVPEVKRYIDYLVRMGYNTLELYAEDLYEIEGEPYFGYLRGVYTSAELKEIDAYAISKGVELIPCIQTLAHFTNPAKLPHFWNLFDCHDILLIPELTCRIENGNNPVRIVCDTQLRTPLSAKLVTTATEVPTIIATCCQDEIRHKPYQEAGCQVWVLPAKNEVVDLHALLQRLGQEKIDSVLVEGGGQLNWSLLQAGLVQRVYTYIAPKIFGGSTAKSPVGGIGVDTPQQAFQMKVVSTQQLGDDFLLEQEVVSSCYSADGSCNQH